jgi:metallophosphoesterase (TIGR03768 family)
MANDDLEQNIDSDKSSGVTRREFIQYSVGTVAYASFSLLTFGAGYPIDSSVSTMIQKTVKPKRYPIDSKVLTTLQKTVKPSATFSTIILPEDLKKISLYDAYGYGKWTDGKPLYSELRKDIMSSAYTSPKNKKHLKLLRFFAITDIHITDKESPSQLIYMQQLHPSSRGFEAGVTSVYSPTMLYTTHVLDAAIQTINALHHNNRLKPIDFVISLGDTCNSTQYNELRWYINVLDGGVIHPSSGKNAGADSIDYQKPYIAAGLHKSIPWYQVIGNHDLFWLGSIPMMQGDNLHSSYTSDEVLAMGNVLAHGYDIYGTNPPNPPGFYPQYYMGVIDGSTQYGEVRKAGTVGDVGFTNPPTVIPDLDRRSLSRTEWKQEFFNTSTCPIGHGFNLVPSDQEEGFACYSFVPKSDIPIKVIVLDNNQREDDGSTKIHGHGFLDPARWDWLKKELADGDAADQLMIIAAHIPISVQKKGTYMEWFDNSANPSSMQNAVKLSELIDELYNHPNLLMWMAGHRHVNAIKAFVSPDPVNAPEKGFWQVETSSLHDFPQQMRLFEINLNSDYTISIVTTNVDPAVKKGTPAWTSRKYAVAAQQIVNTKLIYQDAANTNYLVKPSDQTADSAPDPSIRSMPTGSYNAELLVQLSPAMRRKMRSLFCDKLK